MTKSLELFPPTSRAAHDRLTAFAPLAGGQYAQGRNHDLGAMDKNHVSALSPYVRVRLLDEVSVVRTVLDRLEAAQADRFLTEVFWRTYWKGWLEMRPSLWADYMNDLNMLQDNLQVQSDLRARWEAACTGKTGIAAFDTWAQELVQTNHLHNHARMWFASIWIFTLDLPWQLGADFFLRHLLDGDPAVNTLSWRWVAGLQTRGKTYLARPDNIAAFTGGRFGTVTGLATEAPAPEWCDPPARRDLPQASETPPTGRYGVVLHGDDVIAPGFPDGTPPPAAWVYLDATAGHSPWHMAPAVAVFRHRVALDANALLSASEVIGAASDLHRWATDYRLDRIVTPYAPVGPTQTILNAYTELPGALPLSRHRRPLDSAAWPLATKGFFQFRKHIPALIDTFVPGQGSVALSPGP